MPQADTVADGTRHQGVLSRGTCRTGLPPGSRPFPWRHFPVAVPRDAATPPTTAPHERDAVLLRARRVDGGLAFAFNPFAVGRKLAIRRINRLLSGVTSPAILGHPGCLFRERTNNEQ